MMSIASRISAVDSPNFACSPPDVAQLAFAFRQQAHAQADPRLDPHLRGNLGDLLDLGDLLRDDDHFLAELAADQRGADVVPVLVAVADDQRLGILMDGETGEDLRLRAHFDSVVERPARVEDLLDDFAKLVDLQREHAAI